ncbi:hypothetical protein XAP412_290038 [Xanthomonas phaseoli pv. phaseoli]|uniref:Secreted protein n=1 Tax=Xanthomonas campestris pv. phaseoli TaxID=317013 RepID=A0AB38DZ56_XANCH|nr:hypothetical protein XAP6984_350038 [Xanthomonas phaseoli pv. phaseoli]SON83398.1 hypothetical protein XAP412_290038 [Xanthomonas phaseoli pv. phaseoli]SON87533.1 hypothetical protein XAP7430_320038 [Xanthomonas phaseoli pv. phaseoli]SOO27266.1 hypothetical protein XAP6164_1470002 [Xanthomonas phaseoli pv. phaseoli]
MIARDWNSSAVIVAMSCLPFSIKRLSAYLSVQLLDIAFDHRRHASTRLQAARSQTLSDCTERVA